MSMRTLNPGTRHDADARAMVQAHVSRLAAALFASFRSSLAIRFDEQRARIERTGLAGMI